jgi:hypothetical protein
MGGACLNKFKDCLGKRTRNHEPSPQQPTNKANIQAASLRLRVPFLFLRRG